MIGDETDGTVIPQDLGLNWAISKKKDDYLGKRAQERSHMQDPTRWKLVGLETTDGSTLPDGAYALGEGENENGQKVMQGRVTSSYHSPTLDRGIAMGLVLILFIAFEPEGLAGRWRKIREYWTTWPF